MDETQEVVEDKEKMEVKSGAISFDDLESQQRAQDSAWKVFELADTFSVLVRNIYEDVSIDSQSGLNRLVGEFQQRVDAAMNPNRKEAGVPSDLTSLTPKEHKKDTNEFLVFKSDEGQWRWFAIYSNMYRDNDHPAEIISSKSHRAFTSLVDRGVVGYPELWQWHIEGSAWGKADWLAYADGFAMAAGYVYDGFEFAAKSLATLDGDIRVSHGMPTSTIVRDEQDPSVIIFHVTKEISPLPGWAAANKWTGFTILKEGDSMPIPDEKKDHLRTLGYSDEVIAQIEGGVQKANSALGDAGVESKESPTDTPEVTQEPDVTEESPEQVEASIEETQEESPEQVDAADVPKEAEVASKQEIAEAIAQTINPLIEVVNLLQTQLTEQKEAIAALTKTDIEKIAELKEETPVRSLGDLVRMSIVGNKEARVHGNSALAHDGPQEKEVAAPAVTPVEFLNKTIANQRNGTS